MMKGRQDIALLLLRLAPGLIFAVHGALKLFIRLDQTIEYFATLGFPAAKAFAIGIGALELLGGTALIIGLGTRIFGALFAAEMLVATIIAELPHGLMSPGTQLTLTLFAATLSLSGLGGGTWSLDHLITRRKSPAI